MPQQRQYSSGSLGEIVGHVRRIKPTVDLPSVKDWVNQRVREALDRRPYWSGTLRSGALSIPTAYNAGTVSLATGSATVAGSATGWSPSDKVNSVLPDGVPSVGYQTVAPAAMTGIDVDTLLVVDAAGTQEVVAVEEITPDGFKANFAYGHDPNCTITASALAGRQLRMGVNYPNYTINAVTSTTSLELDRPWAGPAMTGAYTILKIYHTISPDIKDLIFAADLQQALPLRVHVSQAELNSRDPQRTLSGVPQLIADYVPNAAGNMQYEIYPAQTNARQIPLMYVAQWPELKAAGDRTPWFINPNVFLFGALSSALRTKQNERDAFFDPQQAMFYEQRFEIALQAAMMADESKAQQAYTAEWTRVFGRMGASYAFDHEVSAYDNANQWW